MSVMDVSFPLRQGRRVTLRPVQVQHYDWLYGLATSPRAGLLWRLRGNTPSPDAFVSTLWSGVQSQYLIEHSGTGTPLGLVQLYNVDGLNGTGYVSFVIGDDDANKGWPLEAFFLFIDGVFRTWALRKIYLETTELSHALFAAGADRFLTEEGRLSKHHYYDGSFYDLIILALYRETWEENRERLAQILSPV